MMDVCSRLATKRSAVAACELRALPETLQKVQTGDLSDGNPIPLARFAAIQAAKRTHEWIPHCHSISVDCVTVDFKFLKDRIQIEAQVIATAKTGVEVEAITAASVAAITLYGNLSPIDCSMEIGAIKLVRSSEGELAAAPEIKWSGLVIVMSDRVSAGKQVDISGDILLRAMKEHGAQNASLVVLPDDPELLSAAVRQGIDQGLELIVVTGGTGLGERDITHQTLKLLIDRELPGVTSAYLTYSQTRVPTAMLGSPLAGLSRKTLILAIPGSPGACTDAVACLFPSLVHGIAIVKGYDHS